MFVLSILFFRENQPASAGFPEGFLDQRFERWGQLGDASELARLSVLQVNRFSITAKANNK